MAKLILAVPFQVIVQGFLSGLIIRQTPRILNIIRELPLLQHFFHRHTESSKCIPVIPATAQIRIGSPARTLQIVTSHHANRAV